MAPLHVHEENASLWAGLFDEVFLHGLLDTLKLLPFLFLTYLLMEFIEHKAEDKVRSFMSGAGKYAPFAGALLGAVPQCGFSVAAANLYTGRVISLGTVIAVFLSTSDEMLPILIAGSIPPLTVLVIVLYKVAVAMLVGFTLDAVLRARGRHLDEIDIDAICENDNCHCERGILHSALHHTLTISLFVLAATLLINAATFFIGEERIAASMGNLPLLSHLASAIIGLIPNCAASVILSSLYTDGLISAGVMMSGLFSGAGVGMLVLFRVNKNRRENFLILGALVAVGFIFGALFDLIPL